VNTDVFGSLLDSFQGIYKFYQTINGKKAGNLAQKQYGILKPG